MKHKLNEILPSWFEGLTVLWDGTPVEVLSAHAHGGEFRPQRQLPKLGETLFLNFRNGKTGTICRLECWVTRTTETTFWATALTMTDQIPGERLAPIEGPRIAVPESYPPLAWADHPFYDKARFQFHVVDFFKGGMTLTFKKDTRVPIEAMPLTLTLVLPGFDSLTVKVRVRDVEVASPGERCVCTVLFESPDSALAPAVGRYLFTEGVDVSVDALERAGYPVPDFGFAGRFGYARTPEEVREVLALRLQAYRNREGANQDAISKPEQMRDAYDDHSLLLTLKVGPKLVGTGRLVFNDGDRKKTEIGRFVTLPDWLWKGGFAESSRFATVSDIRGRDVFTNLSLHSLRLAYQAGLRYTLADCEPHLLEAYKRRGSQEMGLTFVHPLEGKTLHVIYSDVMAILNWLERERMPFKSDWSPAVRGPQS